MILTPSRGDTLASVASLNARPTVHHNTDLQAASLAQPTCAGSRAHSGSCNMSHDSLSSPPTPRGAAATVMAGPTQAVLRKALFALPGLNAGERRRSEAFSDDRDRDAFLAAHLLVRLCAARWINSAPERINLVQRCAVCGGPHGRPLIEAAEWLAVSLTHTRGYVAAAAAPGAVAVDVERPSPRLLNAGLLQAAFSAGEQALVAASPAPADAVTRLWLVKECLIKLGRASLDELAKVDATSVPAGLYTVNWRAHDGCLGLATATLPLTLELID